MQEIPRITFDHTEILQLNFWMKISFRRMVLEPCQRLVHTCPTRSTFILKKLIYHTYYMKRIDRPYTINEAICFMTFFVPCIIILRICFRLRLAKQQRIEKTYLNEMNRVI